MERFIKDFKNKMETLQEIDKGDFKRRTNLYINRLKETLPVENPIQKDLDEMKKAVLYSYKNKEEIRELVLKKISNL